MTEDEIAGWHCWLSGHAVSKLWEMVKDRETWRAACHGVAKNRTGDLATEQQRSKI